MAEFKGMTGHWVTTKDGRKVFISDDPVDKQEREITEQKKRADELNKGYEAPVDTATYNEATSLAKEAVGNLVEYQAEFEHDEQSGISGEQSARDILSEGSLTDAEVDKVMSGKFDYQLACRTLAELAKREQSGTLTDAQLAKVLSAEYEVNPSPRLLKDILAQVNKQNVLSVPSEQLNVLDKALHKFEGNTTTFGKIREAVNDWRKENGITQKMPIHGYTITKWGRDGEVDERASLESFIVLASGK